MIPYYITNVLFVYLFRIDAVLKDWNDYLMDYPQFFSYIAAIIGKFINETKHKDTIKLNLFLTTIIDVKS